MNVTERQIEAARSKADLYGVRFEGLQEMPHNRPPRYTWTDLVTGNTFLTQTIKDLPPAVIATREKYANAGGITGNQVAFGYHGRTKIGWIHKSTPTRYLIWFREGRRTRTVWRSKSQVVLEQTGRRGKVKNLCPKTANARTPLDRAVALSRRFHGFDPRRVRRFNLEWPKAVALLGPCVRLEYYSKKFDRKGRIYFHDFEKGCAVWAAESPQPDGSNLLLIHGRFEIKPEGITG